MTDKLREKAQQALGALEAAGYGNSYAAIELREALADQAEQEPFGVLNTRGGVNICAVQKPLLAGTKLYAAPVRTKDLTDDEILKCDERSHGNTEWTKKKAFARAVIAADREKNK